MPLNVYLRGYWVQNSQWAGQKVELVEGTGVTLTPSLTPSPRITIGASAGGGDMFKSTYDPNQDGIIATTQLDPNVENTANKGTTNGYAALDAASKVPTVNLGGEGADYTKYLRGDQTWVGIQASGDMLKSVYDPNDDGMIATTQLDPAVETTTGAQGKVDTHALVITGVHGVGTSNVESTGGSQEKVDSHKIVTASVHNFDTSGNAPPQAHNQSAISITTDTLSGDRLPAMSATSQGAVPATGTPTGLFLKDDTTWAAPAPAAHALGGVSHNADTLANLQLKISDADVVAFAGQIGGTAASPDVRGLRESGGQLLTMGAVADTQYLQRSGTGIIGATPGGGSPPAWKGAIAAAWGDGDPHLVISRMLHNPINATPTNISITVARCAFFSLDTALTVNKIRYFGVGALTNVYRVAIYRLSDLVRLTSELAFTTVAQTWGAAGSALNLTLAANTIYFIAVAVKAIGTTAGCQCHSASTGRIGILPTAWPGNLDIDAASPKIRAIGFCQFAVTSGALPNPAATLALQAAWSGGCPAFFLDNNNT